MSEDYKTELSSIDIVFTVESSLLLLEHAIYRVCLFFLITVTVSNNRGCMRAVSRSDANGIMNLRAFYYRLYQLQIQAGV